MNWNREKLFRNVNGFNDTDREIFEFVTNNSISDFTFCLRYSLDDDELNRNMGVFKILFERYVEEHPFRRVWDKLIKDANVKTLIHFTDYGDEYRECAMRVNKLWNMVQYHGLVCMILKAFAERDWDELSEKFDGVYDTYEEAQSNIEVSCYTIVDNLDTDDLKTIINFCGMN